MQEGFIKRYLSDRGFGFIRADAGRDWFFHVRSAEREEDLFEGRRVSFSAGVGRDGRPEAFDVRAIEAV